MNAEISSKSMYTYLSTYSFPFAQCFELSSYICKKKSSVLDLEINQNFNLQT